jgi:excisionase family DNA binding protein
MLTPQTGIRRTNACECQSEATAGGLLTYGEAAEYLSVSDRTVRDEVRAGNLGAVRIGPRSGAVRITRAELDRYIANLPAYEPAAAS